MTTQTSTPAPEQEGFFRKVTRLLRRGKRRTKPPALSPPIPQRIDGNPTDKKTDPWGGPPPG